ncbi:MAG TPA: hypothetical protein VE398_26460 [Acidobacteriota bacterium]|nr:hypothetical protein [Acidobacteriota bacterium]
MSGSGPVDDIVHGNDVLRGDIGRDVVRSLPVIARPALAPK